MTEITIGQDPTDVAGQIRKELSRLSNSSEKYGKTVTDAEAILQQLKKHAESLDARLEKLEQACRDKGLVK